MIGIATEGTVIEASQILGRSVISHAHELEFLCYVASYSNRPVSIKGVAVDVKRIPLDIRRLADYLISTGELIVADASTRLAPEGRPLNVDMVEDAMSESFVVDKATGAWKWDLQEMISGGSGKAARAFSNQGELPTNLIKAAAYWYVHKEPNDTLVLHIDVRTNSNTVDPIQSLRVTVPALAYIDLSLRNDFDLDWSTYCYMSELVGGDAPMSLPDKLEYFNKNFYVGGLYAVVGRKFSSPNDRRGKVEEQFFVRLDGTSKDTIRLTRILGVYTGAENQAVFDGLPASSKKVFFDLAEKPKPNLTALDFDLRELGFDMNFSDESYLLIHFDNLPTNSVIVKSPAGDKVEVVMGDADLAYWLAREIGIEFNRESVSVEYNEGVPMLYDRVYGQE